MKNLFKFIAKAFFGGCIGCLGAWFMTVTLVVVFILIFNATIGPGILDSTKNFLQNLPNLLIGSVSGALTSGFREGESKAGLPPDFGIPDMDCPVEQAPNLELFMTAGNDPTTEHLSRLPVDQSTAARFWVRAPEGITVKFILVLTKPDGSMQLFGAADDPIFTSDPGGWPYSVGGFITSLNPGDYKISIYLCRDKKGGEVQFSVIQ